MARLVVWVGIVGIALWSSAALGAEPPPDVCQPPDASLIKSRGQYTGRADLPDAEKIARRNNEERMCL